MTRRHWTDEELQTMKRMYAEGSNFSAIGIAIDRDKSLVAKKCRQLGFAPPSEPQKPKELWSDEDAQKLETLLNAGCTMHQASEVLKRPESAVRQKAFRMGLKPGTGVDRLPSLQSPAIQRAMKTLWVAA